MNYSQIVESLLQTGHKVSATGEAVALIEVSDCSKPHLILEVLGRGGRFETIFEKELMVKEVLKTLHLPVIIRLSMYGQPVGFKAESTFGNLPEGKSLQIANPEQRNGDVSISKGTRETPS